MKALPPHPLFFFFYRKPKQNVLVRAAITKYYRPGGLQTTVLEARKSKVKVLAGLVPHENPLPGSNSHLFAVLSTHDRRARTLWETFYETLMPIKRALPS